MSLRLESLAMPELSAAAGQPLSLPLDAIDEDPRQPRAEFDPVSLQELADSIALRGVRQPISVRSHPTATDRWMLNFGARRLRASRLAGRSEIPAFVDETADSYDQVIENEQRENLRPLELALFAQRELQAGRSQAEIARRLGKSRAYITYVCALIDAPDCVMQAYREGKCRGVSDLYELRKLHERAPEAAAQLLSSRTHVSRQDLADATSRHASSSDEEGAGPAHRVAQAPARSGSALRKLAPAPTASGQVQSGSTPARVDVFPLRVVGVLAGAKVEIVMDSAPHDDVEVYVRDGEGASRAVPLARVTDLRLERT